MRPLLPLLSLALSLAAPAGALVIDSAQSTLVPSVGPVETLSGTLRVGLGAPLPLAATTTFDLLALDASASGGLAITLDPSLALPAAGVLNPAGAFLIPSLFLELDAAGTLFQLTVPNVTGSFGALPGCPVDACLATSFDVDTGGPAGIVSVSLLAIPEPGSALLAAGGLLWLARARRGGAR